jgi:hypothetical protein
VRRAEDLLRSNPDEAYKALATGAKTSLENVKYSYTHGLVQPTNVEPNQQALIEQASVLKEFGVINVPDVAAFIKDLVHPEFAAKAVSK